MCAKEVRNTDIRKGQQLMADLAPLVRDANVTREMSVSVRQQLADRNRFVAVGAVQMATLNTKVVFEDVADCFNVGFRIQLPVAI